jgi:hypothetical protein
MRKPGGSRKAGETGIACSNGIKNLSVALCARCGIISRPEKTRSSAEAGAAEKARVNALASVKHQYKTAG